MPVTGTGSHRTSTALNGSGRPFSSSALTEVKACPRPAARWATSSLARICPARTAVTQACRLDPRASRTHHPPEVFASPRAHARPAKSASALKRERLRRSKRCWTSTAHETAAAALSNATMSPSPVFFTSRPPVSATSLAQQTEMLLPAAPPQRSARRETPAALEPTRSVIKTVTVSTPALPIRPSSPFREIPAASPSTLRRSPADTPAHRAMRASRHTRARLRPGRAAEAPPDHPVGCRFQIGNQKPGRWRLPPAPG